MKKKKQICYLYVCYPLKKHNVFDYSGVEKFTILDNAILFMKKSYAKYVLAVEKCDEEIYHNVKQYELTAGQI